MATVEAGTEEDKLESLTTYVFSYSDEELAAFEVLPRADGDQYTARLAQRPLAGTRYAGIMDMVRTLDGQPMPGIETWSILAVVGPMNLAGYPVSLELDGEIVAMAYMEKDLTDGTVAACIFVVPADTFRITFEGEGYSRSLEIGEATFYELILAY